MVAVSIEEADARLKAWAEHTAGAGVRVSLAAPAVGAAGSGVSLFLLELVGQPPLRTEQRAPLQLGLRYLVTTWAADPAEEHRLLDGLVMAAMQEEDLEVQLAPLPPPAWAALGAVARPSFVIHITLRRPRPEPLRKPVRGPVTITGVALRPLEGVVLGPGDVPVTGASVELPSAGVAAETDVRGRFRLPGVPVLPGATPLRVRARGRRLDLEVALPDEGTPLVIRFEKLLEV